MALFNPTYSLILPFLFIFTLPLLIIASLTTFFSFAILLFRVILIYIELALAVIPYYLLSSSSSTSKPLQLQPTTPSPTSTRRRKRRSSTSSNFSAGTITPVTGDCTGTLGLSQSVGATRDYEGVGGWRMDNPEEDDDALWTNINSRLELPADHGRRHHHRSLTSGCMPVNRSYSPEAMMNTSRTRTPPSSAVGIGGEYFSPIVGSRGLRRNNSGIMALSVSSASSKGSSGLSIKGR